MFAHLDISYLWMVVAVLLPVLTTGRNVRIVSSGSSAVSEGILEVNLTGSWQVLCVWGFGDVEAHVACRELGYVGGTALPIAAYGPHSGVYTTPFRGCKGDETSLLDCSFDSRGHEDICRGQDTYYPSVHCYNEITTQQGASVNLTNGYHGDVAYFQSGVWGQVCLTYWSDNEAAVACRELGYKGGVATRAESADDQPFTLTGIRCHGNESKLFDCKHTLEICYDTTHRAAVVCYNSGLSVYLADGDRKSGRVEIEYDGVDGFLTLCGLDQPGTHDSKTASLICRRLGFATGSIISNTPAQGDIYWTIEECDGTENNIFMCRNKGWLPDRTSDCSTDGNIVAVSCSVGVNLVGGITTDNVTMGMVEMFANEKWTTVCSHDFGQNDAVVVCRQLGFTDAQRLLPDMFGRFRFSIFATELACIGNETSLSDCAHTTDYCQYSSHASVLCTIGQVPADFKASLSHGNHGTVLIERYGMVGTVCRHGWDDHDSKVLCSQLGYSGGVALGTKTITTRYNPIWLSAVNCTGQENRIQECVSELLSIDPACGTDMSSAGALCFNDTEPSVNLAGGSKSGEGRAEMTYAGVSGTICDFGWTANDAKVLCRQQGFPNGIPKRNSFFGQGVGPVYLDQVECDGTESSILSCPNFGWNMSSHGCNAHNDDAGVICLPWASLLTSRYYGPVTFWDDKLSNYGLVCDDGHFGNVAAEILCKEQGNQNGITVRCSTFGEMSNPYAISNVNCNGTETKLADCKYESTNYCPTNEYISVVCAVVWSPSATQLQLQNADHGYVKVSHFHQYGYICSEGFDDVDATVICKMRGHLYGTAYRHHTQTEKLGNIHKNNFRWLSNLNCSSTANTLDDCDLKWGETCKCDYRTVAGVFCLSQPEAAMIELENGTAMEGRLLVRVNADTKGSVCGDYFSHNEADVVCRQLGYRSGISLDAGSHGNAVGTYFLDSMKCNGNETSFLDCAIEPHYHFVTCRSGAAAVKCYNNVRLTSGSMKPNFGRVELHNGQRWEAVCDDNFDDTEARVVCASLEYVTGRSQCCSSFGPQPVDVEIQVTNMTCDGTEDRPQDCFYDTTGACPSNRYASVLCSTMSTLEDITVRLPENSYYGPVQVRRYGTWGYVCATGWDDEDADVTCRTLGYRSGKAVRNLVDDADVIILGNVKCRGVEQHFGDCIQDKFGADTGCYNREAIAGVICLNTTDALDFKIRGTGKSSALYIHTDNNYLYIDKSEFDDVAASLVCKEMNQTYVDGSAFGFISHIPGVVKFHCTGREDSVFACIGDWDPTLMESVTIASVNCHRGVKLVGGRSHYGIVEVYNDDTWGTICATTFSDSDAGVVCRNLGFDDGISLCCSPFGKADSSVLVSSLQCSGTESYIRQCRATFLHPNNVPVSQATCSTDNYASVVCYNGARKEDYTLSLPKPTFGSKVSELALTYLGVEGRICADGWNDYDAKVACKQQGFKYGVAYTHFVENVTQSNGPYWTSNFTCSGLENDLQECRHVGLGRVQKCDKRHYAGTICFDAEGPTYKISGGDRNSKWGRVEIRLPGEGWGTICNTYWGQNEAQALCKQFGYDIGEVYQGEYTMPPPRLVYDVKFMCTGNEDRLKDCPHGGWLDSYIDTCNSHHSDAGVKCRMIDFPGTSTKGPEPGPEHRKGNTGLVVGVILGCVLVIVLFVIVILVLKWRQNQKGSLGHERFRNEILQQGRDGSLQLHNPLHVENVSGSESIAMDTSGTVTYRSDNAVPNTSKPQYVNPTYDTAHNTTNIKKYDVDNKNRDNMSNNDNIHVLEHGDAHDMHDSSESAYTKLGLPSDSHIYES
ncbi:deleted in malignant brain tumors 1 protein-like [Mizuhopecten yessoensis]|uniref:deleted in malignant brain tumors 1 protein-like n=1 Tax=Mizuhopecten yessoensis TaxID=6573 RepID=UPI000B459F55|nr:deleted in malignant brain tumors 1 protein-like [Mizuhopecten yessoensis]